MLKKLCLFAALIVSIYFVLMYLNINPTHRVGDKLDEFNGVPIYYNGAINHTEDRNTTNDGYNLGLRFQCVEFVKRYYYERFSHKMPNSMGNAKDFFLPSVPNGALNLERNLTQYVNGAGEKPQVNDIVVFAPWLFNRYGHVAMVSRVGDDFIEVVQQNPGPFNDTRELFPLTRNNDGWQVVNRRVIGWLRK